MAVQDLTQDLKEMVKLASREDGIEALLHFGLDWVKRLAPFDLTTVFLLKGDSLVVKAARGRLANQKVKEHVIPLEKFPSIRTALQTRQARAFTEDEHAHGEGDPFDGVLDLPHGHSCMVVPLCAGERALGVLTLDREQCEPYGQATVDLLEIYGQVLAMAMVQAEQNERLRRLHREARERERLLSQELDGSSDLAPEHTESAAMREVLYKAHQVAQTLTPVLILGETGTGKERLASAVHKWSDRAEEPFVKINCAAIPENLLESELFGHVMGAFTGATKNRPGRFQMANGGTILLDEIGEMPIALQAKLLRVLQEGTFEPVGSDRTIKVEVRILAATHTDLPKAICERRFREDLYYRLNVFPLLIPPLRDRLEDLPALCATLLKDLAPRSEKPHRITVRGMEKLKTYHWPGNVRELRNVLERAVILARGLVLDAENLDLPKPPETARPKQVESKLQEPLVSMDEMQRRYIARVMERVGGKIYGRDGAAALLGMKPSTLQSRMKKLGIRREVKVQI